MAATFDFTINGQTLEMQGVSSRLLGKPAGMGALPATHRVATSPFRDGTVHLDTTIGERRITAQFEIDANDWVAVQTARSLLIEKVNPRQGMGVLSWQADASLPEYRIDALVERSSDRLQGDMGEYTEIWTVQFRCPFPYWRAATATTTQITIPDGSPSISGTVTNNGDVASYPTVSVTGSNATNPAWTNSTTGETLSFSNRSTVLGSGDTLTADHQNMTAELDDGRNYIDRLTNGSEFWALEAGDNTVLVSRTSGSGVKTFTVTHYDLYSGI